jgi:CheY-like chemotaxis protein
MVGKEAVLVVDDDATTIMLLRHYLEGIHVTTLVATDGPSALNVLQEYSDQIGLVLLDIAMPHMNGYELCKAIRSDAKTANLPVIAVTARSSPDMYADADAVGIDQVVAKPFKPSAIREVLEKYHLLKER